MVLDNGNPVGKITKELSFPVFLSAFQYIPFGSGAAN
jgi:hypothetical protein